MEDALSILSEAISPHEGGGLEGGPSLLETALDVLSLIVVADAATHLYLLVKITFGECGYRLDWEERYMIIICMEE